MIDAMHAAALLDQFLALPAETEWLDFKEAKSNFDMDDLGRYVSALANEANLCGKPCAWLILGVRDRVDPTIGRRPVVGSHWRRGPVALNELKLQVAQGTSPSLASLTAIEIERADCVPGSRVLMLQVPPAPRGMPVAWKGHYYGRAGESLVALGARYEEIRLQSAALDWSAHAVTSELSWIDAAAIQQGRTLYGRKHPGRAQELASWSDHRFLTELGVLPGGHASRAAVLLFGTAGSASLLGEVAPRITWKMLDAAGVERDYEHFKLPLICAIDAIAAKIRVHTVRILPPGQLAPLELPSYDAWVIREALLNCIAHQDYTQGGRVVVSEWPDQLWFSNEGTFIPGT